MAGAGAGAAHAGQQVLGVPELVCSSATVGCLLQQGSYGYVAAPPALRTTGVRRSVRIDLLIGNNTLPTWAGARRALARLALSHLVTYPLKITLRSLPLASPHISAGSFAQPAAGVAGAGLLGVCCGACEFKMHFKQMVLLLTGLERLPARPLHGQRAAKIPQK